MAYRGFSGGGFVGNHLTAALLETLRPAADNAGRHATVGDPTTVAAPYVSDGTAWRETARYARDANGNVTSLVSGAGNRLLSTTVRAERGSYLPKRLRRATYGRKISNWDVALQNSAGTTSFVTGDLPPFPDGATRVLRLDQNVAVSFGQYNISGDSQPYMPQGRGTGPAATPTTGGFSAGVWVKNPSARTLNFELKIFNVAANRNCTWNAACEPGDWRFITLSPSQDSTGTWQRAVDSVGFTRVAQLDSNAEGPWLAGEYLLFSNVYVDVVSRPRFLLTFDDGNANQSAKNPLSSPKTSLTANVTSTVSNVLTTALAHTLVIGEPIVFGETAPTSLIAGNTYWVKTVPSGTTFTLATDATLATVATTTGFAGTARYQYGGGQDRSCQGIVESYGFRGSLFLVSSWLGTSGQYGYALGGATFMSASDALSMWNDGWAIGSHSATHPSNGDNAGLRLLGPFGYYLSNAYDNLPLLYRTTYGIGVAYRRRVTGGTQASPSVFTCENAHSFLVNQPIVFTDVAPTGCTLGVTYYVRSVPTTTTFSLATDQGSLSSAVNNTTGAWSGAANYQWPGATLDDSAIYADIVAGAEGIKALGIPTAYKFFALPQGGADQYVRSACIRAGITWVRSVSSATAAHSIPVGSPSGGGLGAPSGGWLAQLDAVQTDGAVPISTLTGYVDETIVQGACGCNYHHALSVTNLVGLDRLCSYLRTKVDASAIDVLTCDELAVELGF